MEQILVLSATTYRIYWYNKLQFGLFHSLEDAKEEVYKMNILGDLNSFHIQDSYHNKYSIQ